MKPQVDSSHYRFEKYCGLDRWSSYWYQLKEILACQPTSVLEIGAGDYVVADYVKRHTPATYTTVDIAEDLHPDVIADVTALPFADNQFTVTCAFEVLEHLPWDQVPAAVAELQRVASDYVLVSVPHWGRHFSLDIRVPFFKRVQWQWKLPFVTKAHVFNGQHYWEVGKKGYDVPTVIRQLTGGGVKVVRHYVPMENPYHHFFILRKQK